MDIRFKPLRDWPGVRTPADARKVATFRAPYSKTLKQLEYELERLDAQDVEIVAGYKHSDIRLDGWPRSGARPSEPGVILSIYMVKGNMSFPCDRYTDFEDNLRAIVLSLVALRAVDRYGVTRNSEQYKGWAQIAAPAGAVGAAVSAQVAAPMSTDLAASFVVERARGLLATNTHNVLTDAAQFRYAYKAAMRNTHPDVTGGDYELFIQLNRAAAVLEQHHGISAA